MKELKFPSRIESVFPLEWSIDLFAPETNPQNKTMSASFDLAFLLENTSLQL